MDDKYVKYIKDELKGMIKHDSMYASYECKVRIEAYKRCLDIIEKYERRSKKDASN
jgi:hypothetical protein